MLRQSEPNQVVVRHHWLADYTISFGLLGKKLMVPPLLLWRQETFYIPMASCISSLMSLKLWKAAASRMK